MRKLKTFLRASAPQGGGDGARVFIGQTLATVAFGPYTVHLSFAPSENLVVVLEGTYEQVGPPEARWVDRVERLGDSRRRSSQLMQLTVLRLIDDSDQYESMQIHHGEQIWIV